MAVTTVDYFPATSSGPHDDPVRAPSVRAGSRRVPSRRQRDGATSSGWLRTWVSTIRWDHVVGFLAVVATVVLIVLSALPAQRALPVTTDAPPASSVLGATDPAPATGAGAGG